MQPTTNMIKGQQIDKYGLKTDRGERYRIDDAGTVDYVTYETIGFDPLLTKKPELPTKPINEEETEDIISRRIIQLPASSLSDIPEEKIQASLTKSIRITDIFSASTTIPNNAGRMLTTSISFRQAGISRIFLGVCEATVYLGTTANATYAIPWGSGINPTQWETYTNFDLQRNLTSDQPGRGLTYSFHVLNQSGSTRTITWFIRWRYIGEEKGAAE